MQNKPNLLHAQMNVTSLTTVDYENTANWKLGENKANTKPIQSQSNPIFPKISKFSVSFPQSKLHFFEREPLTNPATICACITVHFIR
jgi:hypothetical protein